MRVSPMLLKMGYRNNDHVVTRFLMYINIFFRYKSKWYWSKHCYYHLATAFVFYLCPPPPLCSHPCIPRFLSPSRQCIPIPHTVAVSSGESCLPCATGPTKRSCSRASPHRPEAEQTQGRKHVHIRKSFCIRPSDSGKSLSQLFWGLRTSMYRLDTC